MAIPDYDGCPWPVDPACLGESWEADFSEEVKTRSIALAGNTLRRLTAYRVGGCPVAIRPCTQSVLRGFGYYAFWYDSGWHPMNWSGVWVNSCGCDRTCTHSRITLPAPNGGQVVVKVDGVELTENTDYWIDDLDVVRMGGLAWPLSQNLDLPDTEVGTFSITYLNSFPVDGLGAYACGLLARQYALACTGDGKCKLPATVTSVVRQGVSYTLAAGSFPNGETGIREVDAYIGLWNPAHRKQGPKVWAP